MTEKDYEKLVQKASPKSPMGKDCLNAFWIGGLICVLGQILTNCYGAVGLDKDAAATAALIEQQQAFTEGLAEGFWYE